MINRFFLLFVGMAFICMIVTAQTIGKVLDSNKRPIEGVTVVMRTTDSTFVGAAVTDSCGAFSIKLTKDSYLLNFQHLLYKPLEKRFSGANAGIIALQEREFSLKEVVVKGELPQVKVQDGALVYDIANMAKKSTISNAYESILHLPGVIEQSEGFTLAGANGVTILLNGKPTSMTEEQLTNLLKNIPISNVEKVEVMYSAPAKLRVRGAAINIVMKNNKTVNSQLRGEIGANYTQRRSAGSNENISLSFSNKKLSTDILYSADYKKLHQGLDIKSKHTMNNNVYDIEQINSGYKRSITHNVRVGTSYQINSNNNLNVAYTAAITPNKKNVEKSIGNFSNSENIKTVDERMHNVSVDYSHGKGLNLGVDYTYYNSPSTQNFTSTTSTNETNNFLADAEQTINRWKIYVGKTHSFKNKWEINYGFDVSLADDKNSQVYHDSGSNDMSSQNTSSNLKEQTYNLYAGFEKDFGEKVSLSMSAAGEYYKMASFHKWYVYPTMQLSYAPASGQILQLNFSSDKSYPDYWSMQEQTSYLNGYAEIQGNPYLKPSTDYTAEIVYILKNKYMANLYFSHVQNKFEQLAYQAADKLSLIYQTVNYDYTQQIGLTLVLPFSINGIWDTRFTLDGTYNKAVDKSYHNLSFNIDKFRGIAVMNNTFKLTSKPDIRLEVDGIYCSPMLQGIYTLTPIWKVDSGLKMIFANQHAELRINGSDLFNSSIPNAKVNYKGQNLKMNQKPDERAVMFSFTYKFGGYKAKQHKAVDTSRFGH